MLFGRFRGEVCVFRRRTLDGHTYTARVFGEQTELGHYQE